MAFSADEVRVIRRSLAAALQPSTPTHQEILERLRLAEAVEEAAREAKRLDAFLRAELDRYRAALPGSATGFLERLEAALETGRTPTAADLAALRALRGVPCGPAERARRLALLARCEHLAELDVRARLEPRREALPYARPAVPGIPAPAPAGDARARLIALPGGRSAADAEEPPARRRETGPGRKVPTPAEVFPPRPRPGGPQDPATPRQPDQPAAPPDEQPPAPPAEERRGA
jgi:hypothetical protein